MKRDHRDFIEERAFQGDRKTINAVVGSLEVLGEAAKNIPEAIRQKYPAIPWKNIMGMRNRLIMNTLALIYRWSGKQSGPICCLSNP